MADNDFKSLKSSTPDGKILSRCRVRVVKDVFDITLGYKIKAGIYFFDSYDTSDDSVFIATHVHHIPKQSHKKLSWFTYNVKLKNIQFIPVSKTKKKKK